MLLLSDPAIAAITIHECGEHLIDITNTPQLVLDLRRPEPAGAYLRSGVVERLQRVQRRLPEDTNLLIIEGHRPAACQEDLFNTHRAQLAEEHTDWTAEQLDREASKYVSPPSVAPHPCGAAVDLTLTYAGHEVDMGTRVNAVPEHSNNACFTAAPNIPNPARRWRNVLIDALTTEGLVNYPSEWWHWSFGDRYWAAVTGAPHAIYGPL